MKEERGNKKDRIILGEGKRKVKRREKEERRGRKAMRRAKNRLK